MMRGEYYECWGQKIHNGRLVLQAKFESKPEEQNLSPWLERASWNL